MNQVAVHLSIIYNNTTGGMNSLGTLGTLWAEKQDEIHLIIFLTVCLDSTLITEINPPQIQTSDRQIEASQL